MRSVQHEFRTWACRTIEHDARPWPRGQRGALSPARADRCGRYMDALPWHVIQIRARNLPEGIASRSQGDRHSTRIAQAPRDSIKSRRGSGTLPYSLSEIRAADLGNTRSWAG